jgi:hypothetical protein
MQTFIDPAIGLNLILNFGIVNFAKKFKYEIVEVGRQLMYAYYREYDKIQEDLKETIAMYGASGKLNIDEDYNGFSGEKGYSGGKFDPLDFSNQLLGLFEIDEKFKEDAVLLYQIRQAESKEFLDIVDCGIDETIDDYKMALELQTNFELKFGADAMPSIKPSQVIEFRDSCEDLDIFRAYIGIKSLIGRNTFATANKPVILSRMTGCKSKAAFEYYTTDKYSKNKILLPTVAKYSKRYHMDRLLLTLAEKKFIMFLSQPKVSVLYFSGYMEPEELAKRIKQIKEQKNLKNRIRSATASL